MIPGGKLTDRYGRVRLFRLGLAVYAVGALFSAFAPGLGVLIVGNSILEGVGTALLIRPVYILTTLLFTQFTSRARAFGAISAMGGIGAAAGPLIGGLITSAISWRAAFIFQALVVVTILFLSRKIVDPLPADPTREFDLRGAVLSAVGLILLGTSFTVASYLQVVRGYDAIQTGVIFTAATAVLLMRRSAPSGSPSGGRSARSSSSASSSPSSASPS